MVKRLSVSWFFFACLAGSLNAQQQLLKEHEEPLKIVKKYFDALKAQDTVAFKNVFLKNAYTYYVLEIKDSVIVGGKPIFPNVFKDNRVIDEHMLKQGVRVELHKRIAMVWVPYDLWLNQNFSYCGVDMFSLVKTNAGWKIAAITSTVEKEGCVNK
ncbi:MAG: nuclear transport factor 2 family protein [Ferruginibacter sp.]